jgi:uncharacterized protein YcbX
MHISELHIYPVKGAAGVAVPSVGLDAFGMSGDRRFMIFDENGMFMTQRECPSLTLPQVELEPDSLVLRSAQAGEVRVAREPVTGEAVRVRVWNDDVDAIDAGDVAASMISAHLQMPVRLVYMPDDSVRPVDPDYGLASDRVSFVDGFPLLLITQESLDALNARLTEPLTMLRFRPNVVVAKAAPHAEDTWRRIRLGTVNCDVVKPCARCATTTVDPGTALRGKEPLRTLHSYRAWNRKVWFGQNVIHRGAGEVCVGDIVEVVESGTARPPLAP